MERVRTRGKGEEARKRYYREYSREKRYRWKISGLCQSCGKVPVEGKTLCVACMMKQRERQRAYLAKKVLEEVMGG